MLTQKISAAPFHKPKETAKKYELMDTACDDLEKQLEEFRAFADEKIMDIKHITNKIAKEIKKDHIALDSMLRTEIENTNERVLLLIEQQQENRRETDIRLTKFVDEESKFIWESIEIERTKRDQEGNSIRDSLAADINEIRTNLDEIVENCSDSAQKVEEGFTQHIEEIATQVKEVCKTYSDNESEFYKMLRDIVKKVKGEITDHQRKREETEAEILTLIEKICDRAIREKTN